MAKSARLVFSNSAGRRIGLPVSNLDAAGIQALAERTAPRFVKRWGTPVSVDYVPGEETAEEDTAAQVTFNLGNLPANSEG